MDTPVSKFLPRILLFIESSGFIPNRNSPAEREIKSFSREEFVRTAFSQASQFFIAATDYFEALDILIKSEKSSIAPWSCARGILESSALCTWLYEVDIDPKERVSRSLSLRYTALRDQQKMARYDSNDLKINEIEDRINSIEQLAISLGYDLLRNRNDKRIGIAQVKPFITDLIESQFTGEKLYRIFSGMAHSNYTTLTELSFSRPDFNSDESPIIFRKIPTELLSSLLADGVQIYSKCLWLRTIQYGFDAAKTAILLEDLYDALKLSDTNEIRFWRTIINI